jgi:hypothetical protein
MRISWPGIAAAGVLQLLVLTVPAAAQPRSALAVPPGGGLHEMTKVVDPCAVATAEQLKLLISGGIGTDFPVKYHKDGEWITLSNPDVRTATCPNLRLEMLLDVRYDRTRGLVQFQSSGTMRIGVRLVANVTYLGNRLLPPPVTAENFRRAAACFQSIQVLTLDIKNVPSWLDNTFIKDWLNKSLSGGACFDVTSLVLFYLKGGETL